MKPRDTDPAIDKLSLIQKVPLMRENIPSDYLEKAAKWINVFRCKGGMPFVIEGSLHHGLYFICAGKVKVLKTGMHGKEHILRFVGKGEMVGHRGFSVLRCYAISAVAIEDCLLCHLDKKLMMQIIEEVPSFTYAMMRWYAQELDTSEVRVKALAHMTVREKVIDTLLYLYRKFGVNVKGQLDIKLSRNDLADYAGTTGEQVVRTLSALNSEDLIETIGKRISITRPDLLKKEIAVHNYYVGS